jgi:putative ABC transport system ATP-binding protein
MENIIEAKGINKVYEISKGNTHQALRNVDITISGGEFVSVMGPSGSGKSTLLYNISGMDKATSGSIRFCGSDLTTMTEDALSALRLRKMGFIFQQSNLLKNLNLLDNIVLPAFSLGKESRKTVVERAKKLMEQTGIAALADNDITQASGGQLQRAAICRALINAPDIVFGDEPTGALNSKTAGEVMDILSEINGAGATILLVSHDTRVVSKTERILFMMDGQIAGEKRLGKYQKGNDDIKARESILAEWLSGMGF